MLSARTFCEGVESNTSYVSGPVIYDVRICILVSAADSESFWKDERRFSNTLTSLIYCLSHNTRKYQTTFETGRSCDSGLPVHTYTITHAVLAAAHQ